MPQERHYCYAKNLRLYTRCDVILEVGIRHESNILSRYIRNREGADGS